MFGLSQIKLIVIGIMLLMIVGLGMTTKRLYDRNLEQRLELAQKDAQIAAASERAEITARLHAKLTEELQTEMRAAASRADRFATIRSQINAAPSSSACASSPAMRALFAGLFEGDPALRGGANAANSSGPSKLRPAPAGAGPRVPDGRGGGGMVPGGPKGGRGLPLPPPKG